MTPRKAFWISPARSARIEGDQLKWSLGGRRQPVRESILDRFTRIVEESDQAILGIARQFGGLGLCTAHGMPWTHQRGCVAINFAEPLSEWRRLSANFGAVVRLARLLNSQRRPKKADWQQIRVSGELRYEEPWKAPIHGQLQRLSVLINDWMRLSGLCPHLAYYPDRGAWEFEPATPGTPLFGYLVVELAYEILGQREPVHRCDHCGEELPKTRRVDTTRRNYCPRKQCRRARDLANQRRRRAGIEPRWKRSV
jgi:hypothetical protein